MAYDNFDVQRVINAKEVVCPSIFLSFHHGDNLSFGVLVIDYIYEKYQVKSKVIEDYLKFGNSTDIIRGYGNLVVPADLKAEDLKVKYYFDVTSHLFDPDRCAPVNTTPSTYKPIEPRNIPELQIILGKFLEHLRNTETLYECMEEMEKNDNGETVIFQREHFSTPSQVKDILVRNIPLRSFDELITDSQYFNKNLF